MPMSAKFLLRFDPETDLFFKGPYNKPTMVPLRLTSMSEKIVAFKMKTTAPRFYTVVPTHGYIAPDSEVSIYLTFNGNEQDVQAARSKHKFLVQATYVPSEESANLAPDRFWKELSKDSTVYEHKLRCLFETEAAKPEPSIADSFSNANDANVKTATKGGFALTSPGGPGAGAGGKLDGSASEQQLQDQQQQAQYRTYFNVLIVAFCAVLAACATIIPFYWWRSNSTERERPENEVKIEEIKDDQQQQQPQQQQEPTDRDNEVADVVKIETESSNDEQSDQQQQRPASAPASGCNLRYMPSCKNLILLISATTIAIVAYVLYANQNGNLLGPVESKREN